MGRAPGPTAIVTDDLVFDGWPAAVAIADAANAEMIINFTTLILMNDRMKLQR